MMHPLVPSTPYDLESLQLHTRPREIKRALHEIAPSLGREAAKLLRSQGCQATAATGHAPSWQLEHSENSAASDSRFSSLCPSDSLNVKVLCRLANETFKRTTAAPAAWYVWAHQ